MDNQKSEGLAGEWVKRSRNKEISILLLGFNRPDLLLAAITRIKGHGYSNLWIAIDGPRLGNDRDKSGCRSCGKIAKKEQVNQAKRHISSRNRGCRDGVIEGIDWFFSNNKEGIILEDDVEITLDYIEIMVGMLEHYRKDKDIWSICSHCDPVDAGGDDKDLIFYKSDLCRVGYGWASWDDRWKDHQEWLIRSRNEGRIKTFMKMPRQVRTKDFCLKIYACRKGHMDAWDYEWNLSHLRNRGKSVTPLALCGTNHGFREDGTHTHSCQPPWTTATKWKVDDTYLVYRGYFNVDKKLLYSNCGIVPSSNWPLELIKLIWYLAYNRIAAPARKAVWKLKGL